MKELSCNTTYCVGDFIIKVLDEHQVRVTTDRGTAIVRPKSDNAVVIQSSVNQHLSR